MRRLPIFFVLDVSESMAGEPLMRLHKAMESIVEQLRQDPNALETVYISVIAFAGRAGMVVPLVELMSFYPPRLPLGGGTALGEALDELMVRIEVDVKKTTPNQRGDWEPIVYLLTDGRPTDRTADAIRRWRKTFSSRAHLIAVTLGKGADTRILKQLTDDVLMLEEEGGEELARFAQWVTASVAAQSQALDAGRAAPGISLAKAGDAGITLVKPGDESTPQDDQVVVLTGRCSRNRKPYLLKYQALAMPDVLGNFGGTSPTGIYGLEGCYGLEEDYFDWTAQRTAPATPVSTDQLEGVAPCPHCGAATTFALGGCDHLMCCDGPGEQTCPWCDAAVNFGPGSNDAFDVGRGLG
ncbi:MULTISPECIES: TerY-C metal binding domain-containing protein [Cobetia]|uniref:VWA domain-containing protein n=1 Tax=Cobetia crustatorum TaxID=553385 RepID=A0A558HLG3_9GAMM|nr:MULTISPECIES: TerY-C metal binding domain-containing protein [Cobetia]TVU69989.1 VWA domain-containing protein [Cobetia crustatorum]